MRIWEIVGAEDTELEDMVFGQFTSEALAKKGLENLPENYRNDLEIRQSNRDLNVVISNGIRIDVADGKPCFEENMWTPVSKGLPKEHVCKDGFIDPSDHVLVQMQSGAMYVTRYWGSRESYKDKPWIDLSYPTTDTVIAWRPRPESYKESKIIVTDIEWSWNSDDIAGLIENKDADEILALFKKGGRTLTGNETPETISEELYDLLRHGRLLADEVFNLPDNVEINAENISEWTEDDITNYLCDEYGFFVNGYALSTDKEK